MKIGIDARFYGPENKGLGRYTKEVLDRVLLLDKKNEYVVFLRKDNFNLFQPPAGARVKKVLADVKWYSLAEQLIFPYYLWREKLDLVHFPHFNAPLAVSGKFVITIHDLILTKFPTIRASTLNPILYFFKNLAYRLVIKTAAKRARLIIAVSRFTKDDIVRQFKIDKEKIKVIYEGISELKKDKGEEEGILKHGLQKGKFLLYVGNAYPHKNLESLIDVFREIKKERKDLFLVLVGKEDYFYRRLKEYAAGEKFYGVQPKSPVIFPGFVADEDLFQLYRQASIYVFPSLYEGFGLPPLEAMAAGCPVASSDAGSLKEILGPAAFYFNPLNKEEMKDKIEKVIADDKLRSELISRGYEQIKKYNWQKCGEETVGVYDAVTRNP